ncbi:MAG: ribonuclease III [Alphaproteobacteria bacterium]
MTNQANPKDTKPNMRSIDPSSPKSADLKVLMTILKHEFKNKDLLNLALTHTSARTKKLADYERLEFLGDRVLGLLVSEELLNKFPKDKEGDLAKRLAQLVRKETLADVARTLKLGSFIRLSRGENASGGRDNPSLLSDVCEALIAALYLDGGLQAARNFVVPNWLPLIVSLNKPPRDAKTELQEWAQGQGYNLPAYTAVSQTGPSHNPVFVVSVEVESVGAQQGEGRSKRVAEQEAAQLMLKAIKAAKRKVKMKKKET